MSLEKLKQLEKMKEEREQLVSKLIERQQSEKEDVIKKFVSQFVKHLRDNEFKVEGNGVSILATFKSFAITLDIPSLDQSFVGTTYTQFKLFESASRRTFLVEIVPVGLIDIPILTKQDEADRIEDIEEDITNYQALLDLDLKPSDFGLAYFTYDAANKADSRSSTKTAKSFGEVIDAIIS